jgi:hypothetical protein
MSHQKNQSGFPGWLKAAITLTMALAAVAGAGHVASGPASRPTTACVELQALFLQVGAL